MVRRGRWVLDDEWYNDILNDIKNLLSEKGYADGILPVEVRTFSTPNANLLGISIRRL